MAEAFGAQKWRFAFHPRIPPFFTTISGIISWTTGWDGFMSTKIASVLFFVLGVFPLYGIFRNIFEQQVASLGVILYICCSYILRLAYSGMRESAKGFSFLLAVYGLSYIYKHRRKTTGYLYCCLGCAGLALLRGDCLIYAVIFLCAALVFELVDKTPFHVPYRSIWAVCLFVLFISPWIHYQYRVIGYPVTETRIAFIFSKIEAKLGIDWLHNKDAEIILPGEFLRSEDSQESSEPKTAPGNNFPVTPARNLGQNKQPAPEKEETGPLQASGRTLKNKDSVLGFIESLIKGFYPHFALFAVPVIFFRIKRKSWTTLETILLVVLIGHALIQVGQVAVSDHRLYVSKRYLLSAAPLSFGWAAIGMTYAYETFFQRFSPDKRKLIGLILLISLFAALYLDGASRINRSFLNKKKRERKQNIIACSEWIKDDYRGIGQYDDTVPLHYYHYYSGRKPVIITTQPAIAYFVKGQYLSPRMVEGNPADFCEQNHVKYIVLKAADPELDVQQIPGAKKVFTSGTGRYGMSVYSTKRR